MTPDKVTSLLQEVVLLREKYRELHLKFRQGKALLSGMLEFKARWEDVEICDSYVIEIQFPETYPSRPPVVREVGGRIPRSPDHHVQPDGTLCLDPPIEVFATFKQKPTLLWYFEGMLIPCLFWHSYHAQHPNDSLPAYSHGFAGTAEYRAEIDLLAKYFQIFGVDERSVVLGLLKIACRDVIDHTAPCPCNSGKPLAMCHANVLWSLLAMPYLHRKDLEQDYRHLQEQHKDREGE